MMHFGTALLCVGLVGPTASLRAPMAAPAPRSPLRAARTPVAPRMVLGLPLGAPPGLGTLFGGSAGPEVLYDGRTPVDFEMETLHLTKRRCSGGVLLLKVRLLRPTLLRLCLGVSHRLMQRPVGGRSSVGIIFCIRTHARIVCLCGI